MHTTTNYLDFLKHIELDELYPVQVQADRPHLVGNLSDYELHVDVQPPSVVTQEQSEDALRLVAEQRFEFVARAEDTRFVRVLVTVAAMYALPVSSSEKDVSRFVASNVHLHTWPYIRVFFLDLLTRMDLPAFPLPLHVASTGIRQPAEPQRDGEQPS